MQAPDTMTLIRAVWASGFRAGKLAGESEALAFSFGDSAIKPTLANDAWSDAISDRIMTKSLNPLNPADWDSV